MSAVLIGAAAVGFVLRRVQRRRQGARARKACDSTARKHLAGCLHVPLILTLCGHEEKDLGGRMSPQCDRSCEECVAHPHHHGLWDRVWSKRMRQRQRWGEARSGAMPSPSPTRTTRVVKVGSEHPIVQGVLAQAGCVGEAPRPEVPLIFCIHTGWYDTWGDSRFRGPCEGRVHTSFAKLRQIVGVQGHWLGPPSCACEI